MKLSIVISSQYEEKENENLLNHINETIGLREDIDYEVLLYNNFNQYSLTNLYNKGLKESNSDIVVFMHNDINFNIKNWGKKLIDHFNNSDYACLGVAGNTDLVDGRWWTISPKMVGIVNHKFNGKTWPSEYSGDFGKEIIEVAVLDGVLFAVNKKRTNIDFDEQIEGFHFYDVDYTFNNTLNGNKCGVIFDIRITHLSPGFTNENWESNKIFFENKYKNKLPYFVKPNYELIREDIKIKNNSNAKIGAYIFTQSDENFEKIKKEILSKTQHKNFNFYKPIYSLFEDLSNDVLSKTDDFILLITEGTELDNDVISILLDSISKYNAEIVSPRILNEDFSIINSGLVVTQNQEQKKNVVVPIGSGSYYTFNPNSGQKVHFCSFNTLLMKKNTFEKFKSNAKENEYLVDTFYQWQLGITNAGGKIFTIPQARIIAHPVVPLIKFNDVNKSINFSGKIGIGMVTYNAQHRIVQSAPTIPQIGEFVIVNDGTPYPNEVYPPTAKIIQHETNMSVGAAKSTALKYLMEQGCEHIFLVEDDVIIKNPAVFFEYIKASQMSGIKHFNYALQGPANRKQKSNLPIEISKRGEYSQDSAPNPKLLIDYPQNVKIALYPNCVGALSYYHRSVIEDIGYFDPFFKNAWEHVEHTYEIIKKGYHPQFWWFADIENVADYVEDIEGTIENSTIARTPTWNENLEKGALHYKDKHGFIPTQTPHAPINEVIQTLEKLYSN